MNTFTSEKACYYYTIKTTYFELINDIVTNKDNINEFIEMLYKLADSLRESQKITLANFCVNIANDLWFKIW